MTNNSQNKYSTTKKIKQQNERTRVWYFITFVRDLPSNRPYCFTLLNKPFVLFRDENENLVCCLLSAKEGNKKGDKIEMQSFEVMQRQDEIWFYCGKS